MRSILLNKPKLYSVKALCLQALMLLFIFFIGAEQVQAQAVTCFRSRDLTPNGNWSMVPGGRFFKNGEIIGTTSAYAQYTMPIAHGDVIRVEAMGQPVSNSYRAVPLPGMPGLGLIVRWMGYDTNGVALTPVAPTVPSTTIISDSSWVQVVRARTTRDYIMTQKYRFELIIIDENQYKGGLLTFVEEYKVTVHTSTQQGTNVYQQCRDGVIDPMAALIGTVQVPELPRPVVTTCRFSADTLNQKVTLGAVDPSQITDTTTLRPEGTAGQNSFLITGTNCNKGAKIDFYLTDARDQSTNKDYLRTTNPAVGIRLFYRGEYEPMPFGPPPSGSWVPSRYAGSLGPAPTEGATLTSGFTAQYVRLPNYSQGDIKPGPLTAEAIVVIVYP